MTTRRDDQPANIVWEIGASRDEYYRDYVQRRDALADAARGADWDTVLHLLTKDRNWINAQRIGSTSGYAPLHQAAWHGADRDVVQQLLDAGAWRTCAPLTAHVRSTSPSHVVTPNSSSC